MTEDDQRPTIGGVGKEEPIEDMASVHWRVAEADIHLPFFTPPPSCVEDGSSELQVTITLTRLGLQ